MKVSLLLAIFLNKLFIYKLLAAAEKKKARFLTMCTVGMEDI
jgi:hypothetical protein